MSALDDLKQTKNAELKASFIRLLPKRLSIIGKEAQFLCHENWNLDSLNELYDEIQHLAGAAGTYGLVEISDRLFSLEVYLASFVDSGISPTAEQLSQIENLAQDLSDSIAGDHNEDPTSGLEAVPQPPPTTAKGQPDTPVEPSGPLGILRTTAAGPEQDAVDELCKASILSDGFKVQVFPERADFLSAMRRGGLRAAILTVDGIAGEPREIAEAMAAARDAIQQRVPLILLASSNDLAIRLQAMRCKADAFFCTPVDTDAIAERIIELLEPPQTDPYRVLIVEDDRSQAIFCESILRKAGMHTASVNEPLQAIETLDKIKPDIILMDLYMPTCDGAELTSLIRERQEYVGTPIVFLSGEKDKDRHLDALSHGGDDFLSKPIRPRHLISAVTIRAQRARALRHQLARTPGQQDPMTGLHQRAHVLDHINQAVAQRKQISGAVGVAFIKIDAPEKLRDQVGYMGLDALLGQLGTTIASTLGPKDLAARLGDTTFVVLRYASNREDLQGFARGLCKRIARQLFDVDSKRIHLSTSIGVAPIATKTTEAAAILNQAEAAAVLAAEEGGGQVRVHEPATPPQEKDQDAALASLLRRHLEQQSLEVLFQPLVSLNDTTTEQYQTLLRMRDDSGQLLTAGKFVPVAMQLGLINELDRFALGKAIAVLGEHQRQQQDTRLFVSQAVSSILQPGRCAWIKEKLVNRRIQPGVLCIELPMTQIAGNLPKLAEKLHQLAEAGVGLSVSAFTGGGQFQMLDALPVEYVKAAPALLVELTGGASSNERFNQMVEEAHRLDKLVIAPMIENASSVIPLWASGVDYIQGNFVQRPDSSLKFDFAASTF